MKRRNILIIKILIFVAIVSLIVGGGYVFSALRYDDVDLSELEALKIQNQLLQTELEEIERLKSIQGEYLIGKVILRNMHEFYNEIVINLGSDDAVCEGDAVINGEGLVGIVYKVDKVKSYVKLVSSDYNISVKVNDTYGNLSAGSVSMLNKYSELKEGDKVYTSNYGGMPENIYVGEIEKIGLDNENLGQKADVKLIDTHYLNYVAVLLGEK